jgi:hypothetical protein
MADTRVLSNRRIGWFAGPDSEITSWTEPPIADLQALDNISEAIKIDGTDFNIDASEQGDDRSFTDEAGAQSRTYASFGGNLEAFTPKPEDTTSILRQTKDTIAVPRTELAVAMRVDGKFAHLPIAAGDEISLFHVMSDARAHHRGESSYSYGVNLVPRSDNLVNYIVPSAVPTSPAINVVGPIALAVGAVSRIKVAYEGRNITIGAVYTSSDPTVAEVT